LLLQLSNTLHNHKPAKTSHARVEGLQIGGLPEVTEKENLSDEARDKARQNRCDYVLVVNNPDVRSSLSAQPNVLHPERQETTSTYDPYMRRQDHDFYVTINYRLFPIESATTSAEGFVSTHDAAPERRRSFRSARHAGQPGVYQSYEVVFISGLPVSRTNLLRIYTDQPDRDRGRGDCVVTFESPAPNKAG
jgi:hypothetical protein